MNIFGVLGDIIEAGAKAVGAGAKTLTEVADNFSNNLRFKLEKLPRGNDDLYEAYGIFVKGNPQVALDYDACLIFKLYDKETKLPLLSTLEVVSEESSRVFEHTVSIGNMSGKYWVDWGQVSALIPESLVGPHKGKRELELRCFVWYEDLKPKFIRGVLAGASTDGFISQVKHEFELELENTGYLKSILRGLRCRRRQSYLVYL